MPISNNLYHMALRLASKQLAVAARKIHINPQWSISREWCPAVQHCVRLFSATASGNEQTQRLVTAYLKGVLSSLSIPHGELDQLAASPLSDAALIAWALTKTASHPAMEEAAAISGKLQRLLTKLDAAVLWQQQAAASPLGHLLWRVAVGMLESEVRAMSPGDLQAEFLGYEVVEAGSSGGGVDALLQQLPQFTDTSAVAALGTPAFWQLAQSAAAQHCPVGQDLQLLGYDLQAAAGNNISQTQQIQQLLGLQVADLQQQLLSELKATPNILLHSQQKRLVAAVGSNRRALSLLSQLQLLHVLAQAVGYSSVHVLGGASPAELVTRLTGVCVPCQPLDEQVMQQLRAAAPELLATASQVTINEAEQPSVGKLLQMMSSKPSLQAAVQSLTAWRSAAAAGNIHILTTLNQAEVAALTKQQAEAIGQHIMQLEARGRLLVRKAAAQQLALGSITAEDGAALAWKLHTGGEGAVNKLTSLLLTQAAHACAAATANLDSAAAALSNMAAGFHLEDVTSRRSSAAPPSPLVLAGVPQHQVAELAKSYPALAGSSGSTFSSSSLITVEALVRDLSTLFSHSPSRAAGHQSANQRLQVIAHDLPKVLSGPLLDLLAVSNAADITDAAGLKQQQQRLQAFISVLESELPRLALSHGCEAPGSSWSSAAGNIPAAGDGVLELLGEQDSRDLLQHAAAMAEQHGSQEPGLYEQLADIHHDVDVQRYLQMEFDPSLDVDVVHAPRGWRDADLWVSPTEFLDSMKPLLDKYLAAQGEPPVEDLEWHVYRDSALAEHEQVEVSAASSHTAAGHSPFHNSRADEAYLTQRLEAGIPRDNVLYTAAHKYLKTSFKNSTWRFAQRKHMVDRLIEIASHLAAHPPRTHRGSPFSPLFQTQGPPAVPRLSRRPSAAGRVTGDEADQAHSLPEGFGRTALP